MTDSMQISAEDRERLAKSKFGEWFDEFFEKKFEEAFEKKAGSARRTRPNGDQGQPAPQSGSGQESNNEPPVQRRRSLLETCLSDTFGF
jgi:hypothetical protein